MSAIAFFFNIEKVLAYSYELVLLVCITTCTFHFLDLLMPVCIVFYHLVEDVCICLKHSENVIC